MNAALRLWRRWRHTVREREELAALDHRERRDIGLTPLDVARLSEGGGRPPRA